MRYPFLTLLFITLLGTCGRAQNTFPVLTESQRKAHLERREDSTTWDRKMLAEDLQYIDFFEDVGPMRPGVFPEPDYDLIGKNSFDGVFSAGTIWKPDTIANKAIGFISFGVGKNTWHRPFMGTDTNQVFFTLVTVIDTLDADGDPLVSSLVLSRNNPDVMGECSIRNTVGSVDCVAFTTAENDRFAIVNMRLFNLKYGDVIVIAPQKDGSFRSLQIKEKPRTKEANNQFIKQNILKREKVLALLTRKDVL
jgi:hypothetical protein